MRVFELPINSTKDVLLTLPSLFEDFIDITNKRFYTKRLEGNSYLCFAYDEQKIIDNIKASNLSLSQINSIYFAQIELESIVSTTAQTCMKIDNICLGFSNNILVQVPLQLQVNTNNDIDISSIKLSKHSINVRESSKYISSTSSYTLSIVMVTFALIIFIKTFVNNQIISSVPNKIDSVKQDFNMPSSTLQANSIINRLNKISQKQTKLREAYKYIFDFKSKYGGQMISCNYKSSAIKIKIKDIKAKKIVDYLEKRYTLTSAVVKDGIVTIGISL